MIAPIMLIAWILWVSVAIYFPVFIEVINGIASRAVRSGPVRFFTLLKGELRTGPVYFFFIYYETGTGTGKNRSINPPTWNQTGCDRSRTGLIMTGPELDLS